MKRRPETHKRPAIEQPASLVREATASQAIGSIELGAERLVLTFGQFSLIDTIVHIVQQIGPADVALSTWTAANYDSKRCSELLQQASISRFRLIIDHSFSFRQPEFCAELQHWFGIDCIRHVRTHAKFAVLRSATHQVSVLTSMNLNNNPRLEFLLIREAEDTAAFLSQIVDSIFTDVSAGETRSRMLPFKTIADDCPFQPVEARPIPYGSLHEPKTTHTLKTR